MTVIEGGKSCGQLAHDSDTASLGTLFIGMIQGLVMQSLLAGDVQLIRREARGVFALFRRAVTVRT